MTTNALINDSVGAVVSNDSVRTKNFHWKYVPVVGTLWSLELIRQKVFHLFIDVYPNSQITGTFTDTFNGMSEQALSEVQRAYSVDRESWWQLILLLIPFIGFISVLLINKISPVENSESEDQLLKEIEDGARAFLGVSDRLRKNSDFVMAAVKANCHVIRFIDKDTFKELFEENEFLTEYVQLFPQKFKNLKADKRSDFDLAASAVVGFALKKDYLKKDYLKEDYKRELSEMLRSVDSDVRSSWNFIVQTLSILEDEKGAVSKEDMRVVMTECYDENKVQEDVDHWFVFFSFSVAKYGLEFLRYAGEVFRHQEGFLKEILNRNPSAKALFNENVEIRQWLAKNLGYDQVARARLGDVAPF